MSEKRHRWDVIHDRIKHIENPVGAEIGVHRGECSGHLLEMHQGLKLYMIDMWSPDTYKGKGDDAATEPYRKLYEKECDLNHKKAIEAVKKYKDRVVMYKMSSMEAVELFPDEMLDFVFIDASHSYEDVKADIIAWLPKVKQGGYLMGHDIDLFQGVNKAVEEFISYGEFELEKDSDYFWAVRV